MLTYKRQLVTYNLVHTVTRRLPAGGHPLTKVGAVLKPYEIVGIGEQSAGFRSLNLAKLLSVRPGEVRRFLLKKEDAFVYQGELLAKKREYLGMREVEIHSPLDGILSGIDDRTGIVHLQYLPKKVKVPAGVAGEVIEVSPTAVKIKTVVSQVQGVIGSGKTKEGTLKVIGSWELPLQVGEIVPDLSGKIIAGGSQVGKEVLYKCLALGVRGVVSGGINFADFQDVVGPRGPLEDVGVGLLVLFGFGNFPVAKEEQAVFEEFDGRPAFLHGAQARLLFPEFQVNKASQKTSTKRLFSAAPNLDSLAGFGLLKKGQRVRLLTLSYLGLSGIIKKLELPGKMPELPSGVRARTVVVKLADGREVEVAGRDVEIFE